ncbi:phage/plasmid primase, P4 family [Cellulosimicrobium funkei]|uniref:DNA primase family protein n=1 Tax=Cellulosimicrobium funkei TaxID=264251 RepID=UPI0037DD369B
MNERIEIADPPEWFAYDPQEIAEGSQTAPDVAQGILEHRGQARFAYRLAEAYTGRLLHVHGLGWHTWDGTRWAPDERGAATRAVLDVLRREWKRAFDDKELARDVKACETAAGVRGVLDLASALEPFAATVGELDADPYLLNVANGTLDLRTMTLRCHDPADRITKVTRAAYTPGAMSPDWDRFLTRVLPDEAVREYLQRFVGVALLGAVREQVFTIATGAGANGKGVFYGAVLHALGDYAHAAESDLFMTTKSNANAASPAVMALRGRRFVVCSETERDHRLAAALMKNLTGGDPITARALHRDPVTFDPSHTVLMVTNFLPKVAGNDPAVWRRMRVVPFDVVIPPAERDAGLGERLHLAADAILAWAVDGYRRYLEHGFAAPDAVLAATADYQKRSDAVARFIEDRCITGPNFVVAAADLFTAWSAWIADDGSEPLSKRDFGEELDKRGFRAGKSGSKRTRKGIDLQEVDDE